MKFFAILYCSAAFVFGAEALEARRTQSSHHQADKRYGRAEYFHIANSLNTYMLYFQWIKPSPKQDGRVNIGLPDPVFWYSFPARDFMRLVVDGIDISELEPKSFRVFATAAEAGVEAFYNFNGVGMTLRFFMKPDSPMLFLTVKRSGDTPKSVVFKATAYPSFAVPNGGRRDAGYRREIDASGRKITPKVNTTGWFSLTKNDRVLTFYDNAYEPTPANQKPQGPCSLYLDWNTLRSGRVWFGNIYCANVEVICDPTAAEWNFGFLEFKKKYANKAYFDYIAPFRKPLENNK